MVCPCIHHTERDGVSLASANTSARSGETYYFKVNGVPIFAKGANLVPLRVIASAVTKGVIQDTMDYALATNMNMIRIWGGGSYMVSELYPMVLLASLPGWLPNSGWRLQHLARCQTKHVSMGGASATGALSCAVAAAVAALLRTLLLHRLRIA
jgi:hypothetical protein